MVYVHQLQVDEKKLMRRQVEYEIKQDRLKSGKLLNELAKTKVENENMGEKTSKVTSFET